MHHKGMNRYSVGGVVPEWTIGDRLRKAREHAGLTQSAAARTLGVSRQSVARYESGDRQPPLPVVMAWALVMGVDMAWLQGEEDDEDAPRLS